MTSSWWIRFLRASPLGLAVAGCATVLPAPSDAHARIVRQEWPDTTTSDLERGRSLYARRCNACHALHVPNEIAPAQWPAWMKKMAPRAKLGEDEQRDILRYLMAMSPAR